MHKNHLSGLVTTMALLLSVAVIAGCQSQPATGHGRQAAVTEQPREQPVEQKAAPAEDKVVQNTKLSETPGAPVVIEEIPETSDDTPRTTPVVDPVVTDPTPTVTDTPIPTQLVGLQYAGGQSGALPGAGDFGATVFGNGGNARKIAFIVDASGSMIDVLPFVENELKRSVKELRKPQEITIIVFSGKGVYEVPGGGGVKGLRAATPEFKDRIHKWISDSEYKTGGRGEKHAEAAILRALRYEPQLVFLMSDNLTGGGQGATRHEIVQDKLMQSISKANKADPPTKFNTIQFLYQDPLVKAGLTGTLQLLADETGGNYKFIDERDLNLK